MSNNIVVYSTCYNVTIVTMTPFNHAIIVLIPSLYDATMVTKSLMVSSTPRQNRVRTHNFSGDRH